MKLLIELGALRIAQYFNILIELSKTILIYTIIYEKRYFKCVYIDWEYELKKHLLLEISHFSECQPAITVSTK